MIFQRTRQRLPLLFLVAGLLAACAGNGPRDSRPDTRASVPGPDSAQLRSFLDRASAESERERIIEAGLLAAEAGELAVARQLLSSIDEGDEAGLRLLQAKIAQLDNDSRSALFHLNQLDLDALRENETDTWLRALALRSEAHLATEQYLAAARDRVNMGQELRANERISNNNRIWQILTSAPTGTVSGRDALVDSYELRGWLELLNVNTMSQDHIEDQIQRIDQWRGRWAQHSAAQQLPDSLGFLVELWENRPTRIALLLPLQQAAGRAVSQGFMSAYYHSLSDDQEVPEVRIYDTSEPDSSAALYQQASEHGADLIIGPLDKDAVRALQSRGSLPVPTLALNYGDEGRINPANLYQFGLAPEDEIRQAASMAWHAGHRNASVLTPAGGDFQRIHDHFVDHWQSLGGTVVSDARYLDRDSYSDAIRSLMAIDTSEQRAQRVLDLLPRNTMEFTPRRRQDVDFVFLLASPGQGRQIIPTMGFHYAGDVPVFAMPSIYDGSNDTVSNRDLDGIVFTDAPWLLANSDPLLEYSRQTWPRSSGPVERLRAMGVDAYRLHSRLAQLHNYPETRLQGATGTLSLSDDGSIRRHLLGARFDNGEVRILAEGELASGLLLPPAGWIGQLVE